MKKDKIINIAMVSMFQLSSLSIIVGIIISSIFIINEPSNNLGHILPITIMATISTIIKCIYIFILNKEYGLVKFHMKKNWIIYEWTAIIINIINMLFAICYISIGSNLLLWNSNNSLLYVIILIAITFSISLIAVGFHQYFLYRTRLDKEKRKKGE